MKESLSIQDFSKLSGIPPSTLRYWESVGLFHPMKRDADNNYRYYSPVQLSTLNFIKVLTSLGIPLKTIVELRKDRTPDRLLALLEKRERELDMELRNLLQSSSIIHTRQDLIRHGQKADPSVISIQYREERRMILWPRNTYSDGDTYRNPLLGFTSKPEYLNVNLGYPVGAYWDDLDSFLSAPAHPHHYYSVDPTGSHLKKGTDYLLAYKYGYYGQTSDLPDRIKVYIAENNVETAGPVYVIYMHDEVCTNDPELYLSQISVAVSNRSGDK